MSKLEQLVGPPSLTPTKKMSHSEGDGLTVEVIPYDGNYDNNGDLFLPWFWRELKRDGLIELYFPGMAETGFPSFVKLFSGACKVLLVVLKNAKGDVENAVGFATLEPTRLGEITMGQGGFIFLRKFWDHHTSDEAAQKIMKNWFDGGLDVVVGIVAEENTLAKRFLHRIGWAQAGSIPHLHVYKGKQCSATLWYKTRGEFEGRTE